MRVNIAPRSASARAIRSGVSEQPEADVLGQRRLDLVGIVRERAGERHAAQHLEALVGARRSPARRPRRCSPSASSVAPALLEHRRHLGVDGQPAEVAAPGDPQPAHVAVEVGARTALAGSRADRAGRARRAPAAAARRRAACARSSRAPGAGSRGRRGRRPGSGRGRGAGRRGCRTRPGCGRSRRGRSRRRTAASRPRPRPPRRRWSRPACASRSYGLRVAPKTALNVCEPAPNSGVFVLPITIAPAARRRSTSSESCSGTCSANSGEPYVVRIPAVSSRSLTAIGRPCRAPRGALAVRLVGGVQRELGVEQRDDRVHARVDRRDPLEVRLHHLARGELTGADARGELRRGAAPHARRTLLASGRCPTSSTSSASATASAIRRGSSSTRTTWPTSTTRSPSCGGRARSAAGRRWSSAASTSSSARPTSASARRRASTT